LALRCISNLESVLNNSLLDTHGPVLSSAEQGYQLEVGEQLLRFANSADGFQARDLNILLRSLMQTKTEDRLPWWLDVRACRRRAQKPHQQLPVAKVFVKADEFDDLTVKALMARLRWAFQSQGLEAGDAFIQFDSDRDGRINNAELAAGLEWMGLHKVVSDSALWPEQVRALFQFIDSDHDNSITLEEFNAAVEATEEFRSVVVKEGEPGPSPAELRGAARAPKPPPRLAQASLRWKKQGRFKLKWKPHKSFDLVWKTPSSVTEGGAAFWGVKTKLLNPQAASFGTRGAVVKQKINFGHWACAGTSPPTEIDILEVTDEDETGWLKSGSMGRLNEFLSIFFPHPTAFEKVWVRMPTARGMTPLYIWRPVPLSKDYVSLGMVATVDDVEPAIHSVRCVHRSFARDLPIGDLVQLWTDPGTAGLPACVWAHGKAGKHALFALTAGPSASTAPEVFALQRVDGGRFYMDLPGQGDPGTQSPQTPRTPAVRSREGSEERRPPRAEGPAPVKAKSCFRIGCLRDSGEGDKRLASVEHDLDAYRRNFLAMKQALETRMEGKQWEWIGDEPNSP